MLQERVAWAEQIVLPFGEHLYIVEASPEVAAERPCRHYIVKCDCGHEFCDYRENWKLEALINVRETDE